MPRTPQRKSLRFGAQCKHYQSFPNSKSFALRNTGEIFPAFLIQFTDTMHSSSTNLGSSTTSTAPTISTIFITPDLLVRQNENPSQPPVFGRSTTTSVPQNANVNHGETEHKEITESRNNLLDRAALGRRQYGGVNNELATMPYVSALIRHIRKLTPETLAQSLFFLDSYKGYGRNVQASAIRSTTKEYDFGFGYKSMRQLLLKLLQAPNMLASTFEKSVRASFAQDVFNPDTLDAIHSAAQQYRKNGGKITKEACMNPAHLCTEFFNHMPPKYWRSLEVMFNEQPGYVEQTTPTSCVAYRNPPPNGDEVLPQIRAPIAPRRPVTGIVPSAQPQGEKRKHNHTGTPPQPGHHRQDHQESTTQRPGGTATWRHPDPALAAFGTDNTTMSDFTTGSRTFADATGSRRIGSTRSSTADTTSVRSTRGHSNTANPDAQDLVSDEFWRELLRTSSSSARDGANDLVPMAVPPVNAPVVGAGSATLSTGPTGAVDPAAAWPYSVGKPSLSTATTTLPTFGGMPDADHSGPMGHQAPWLSRSEREFWYGHDATTEPGVPPRRAASDAGHSMNADDFSSLSIEDFISQASPSRLRLSPSLWNVAPPEVPTRMSPESTWKSLFEDEVGDFSNPGTLPPATRGHASAPHFAGGIDDAHTSSHQATAQGDLWRMDWDPFLQPTHQHAASSFDGSPSSPDWNQFL